MSLAERHIPDRLTPPAIRALKSWETLLLAVTAAIFVANSPASPYFLNAWNLSDATFNFTEKAMIAFAMALLIISGEIDLSVASIIALASTAMGAAVQRWWAHMADIMETRPDNEPVAVPLETVFYMP